MKYIDFKLSSTSCTRKSIYKSKQELALGVTSELSSTYGKEKRPKFQEINSPNIPKG